ncbi:MAG: DUF4160 domain-containing protein [Woeseiaceae bacterium]
MDEVEWIVAVPDEQIGDLAKSLAKGPLTDDYSELRFLAEETVALYNGLKVEIFSDEHPPPHFRVKYSGETANYTIKDCTKINGGLDK